jgi:hypothetical protein
MLFLTPSAMIAFTFAIRGLESQWAVVVGAKIMPTLTYGLNKIMKA